MRVRPASHRQIGDVCGPDPIEPGHPKTAQQGGVGFVPLRRLAGVGLPVERHEVHQPHQAGNETASLLSVALNFLRFVHAALTLRSRRMLHTP